MSGGEFSLVLRFSSFGTSWNDNALQRLSSNGDDMLYAQDIALIAGTQEKQKALAPIGRYDANNEGCSYREESKLGSNVVSGPKDDASPKKGKEQKVRPRSISKLLEWTAKLGDVAAGIRCARSICA